MAQIDGQPDHAAPEPPVLVTQGFSPKAILAGVGAFVLPIALAAGDALLGYLLDNPSVFSALPVWVQVPLLAAIATLGATVAAYRAGPGQVQVRPPQAH